MSTAQQSKMVIWGKRLLTVFFLLLIPTLLYLLAKNLDWDEVREAITGYSAKTLALGVVLVLCSYVVFSLYDILGRYYTRHKLPARQVMPVAMVCYAFNLNFTTWVGGVALRYRLYTRLGLKAATVTRIISLGLLTNWTGYMALAGVIFSLRLIRLPESWGLGMTGLQLTGFLLLAVVATYLAICALSKQRVWAWRDHSITLPSFRLALLQLCLGASNWALMAALIYLLLPSNAFYPSILGVLLISCVAGAITHIPAGLGVLEAVFLALLQHQFSQSSLVAALLGYRALYFLLPLLIACIAYLILEKRAKHLRSQHEDANRPASCKP
ncbi:lysylphosphatidylglycerol synthase domain-containing protein [Pseudomonas sp. EA_35y_Pfl2_R5]|uniref:lysylphosphatidylglycerol synthase domain-containing protein n=1 Tax=Pseudomonas sp. EA_35y_Pfl2_R5 TaxID=3088690 RepID=UPI0030D96B37